MVIDLKKEEKTDAAGGPVISLERAIKHIDCAYETLEIEEGEEYRFHRVRTARRFIIDAIGQFKYPTITTTNIDHTSTTTNNNATCVALCRFSLSEMAQLLKLQQVGKNKDLHLAMAAVKEGLSYMVEDDVPAPAVVVATDDKIDLTNIQIKSADAQRHAYCKHCEERTNHWVYVSEDDATTADSNENHTVCAHCGGMSIISTTAAVADDNSCKYNNKKAAEQLEKIRDQVVYLLIQIHENDHARYFAQTILDDINAHIKYQNSVVVEAAK